MWSTGIYYSMATPLTLFNTRKKTWKKQQNQIWGVFSFFFFFFWLNWWGTLWLNGADFSSRRGLKLFHIAAIVFVENLLCGQGAVQETPALLTGSITASQDGGSPLLCQCGCPSPVLTDEVSALHCSPLITIILRSTAALDLLLEHHSLMCFGWHEPGWENQVQCE